jgi:shikimate dehydrogenase
VITGATRIAGVIGDPVTHSLSPALHNAAFAALDLDWVYVALPVSAGRAGGVPAAMRTLGIRGLSVTTPHKDGVAVAADRVSDDVALLAAANTLLLGDDGIVSAQTTDGDGCVDALRAVGCDPSGLRCAVLGAGGAGRAVVLGLARSGAADIAVVNRSVDRAEQAVACGLGVARVATMDDVAAAHVVINATSVGMGDSTASPVPDGVLSAGQWVNDLVYHPRRTALLSRAEAVGAHVVDGLGMLVHQAARQFLLWTGHQAPIAVMTAAAEAELERRAAVVR